MGFFNIWSILTYVGDKNERKKGLLHSCKEWMNISLFWLYGLSILFTELVRYTEDWIPSVEFERLYYLFCKNIAL